MAYVREHGYCRPDIGAPDTRTRHAEGNVPTPSGKCELFSQSAPGSGNFVVPPFRQMDEA